MKKIFLFTSVVLIVLSCGPTIQVYSDRDASLNISNYKTFDWLDTRAIESRNNDPRYYNELTDQRIIEAVNKELESRGFGRVSGNAQMLLHYHIIIDDKTTVVSEPLGMFFSPDWENKRVGTYRYREGTLIIDAMDAKTGQLLWRGWATDAVTEKTMKNPEDAIRFGIGEIFKKFP